MWRSYVPESVRFKVGDLREARRARRWRRPRRLGELRRTTPFGTWGESRGGPIDRYYVDRYLEAHAADIRGRVLEVTGDEYATAFGTGVERVDILDIEDDNPRASFVADIANAPNVPDDAFDCVLVTQLLPFVWDVRGAFRTSHRVLRSGGVLLVTTPGICRIAPVEAELYGHWWNFTSMSAARLAAEQFGEENVEVTTYGNVLAAAAYLFGLGLHDLAPEELAHRDPAFQVTIGVRAVKRP
jgi:SAM-dependent methyltransferase